MKRGKWVVIKSYASESGGYEESRIAALTHTRTHTAGERSHTTLSSIVASLVTPPLAQRYPRSVVFRYFYPKKIWQLIAESRKPLFIQLTAESRKPLFIQLIAESRKPPFIRLTAKRRFLHFQPEKWPRLTFPETPTPTAKRGIVAKGAFGLTYNEVREDKESTENKTSSLKRKERCSLAAS